MSNEMDFFVYLLEKYAEYKGESASQTLSAWESSNLIEHIRQMYPMYHTERIENAFADIDSQRDGRTVCTTA